MKIKYIGKCVFIEEEGERVLVIGDLHLGYEDSMRASGIFVPGNLYNEIISDLEKIFERVRELSKKDKIDKIILLGDLKHEFGVILREERKEVLEFIKYLEDKCDEIIIVKGNHDAFTKFIVKDGRIKIVSYHLWKDICFLHGDKDFKEIHGKEIKSWIVGHAHPAIVLSDGIKEEKFKCFLVGKYRGKRIIIVPSFFSANEGTDPRDFSLGLAWDFKLNNFNVMAVNEKEILEAFNFGKLRSLRS